MLIRRRPQWSAACLCLPLALSSFVAVRTFAAGIALQRFAMPAGSPHCALTLSRSLMATSRKQQKAQDPAPSASPRDPGQIVLVLQGGGALGAYQVGVYQALHEAGMEPQWLIGTSIGAINGAIIAGNPPEQRMNKLSRFWHMVQQQGQANFGLWWSALSHAAANYKIYAEGIDGFFKPNLRAAGDVNAEVGVEQAAFYSTEPLRDTLASLIDFDYINDAKNGRLTLGAVSVVSGEMGYFDSRDKPLGIEHVMASGALPPAFPAIRIDAEAYWDGGIYSNSPIEAVMDDRPRRNSLIFSANVWHPQGPEPQSVWQVMGRQKDIQYASRDKSHVRRQQQIHRLRHVIRELGKHLPAAKRDDAELRELLDFGCATVMHVVPLLAPRLVPDDLTKDIDFSAAGIEARWQAGYADTRRQLELAPWLLPVDTMDGVIIHEETQHEHAI
jgi:NTE family protein